MIEIGTLLGWIVNLALLTFLVIFIKVITPSSPRQNRKSTPAFPLHLTPLLGRGREIDQLKRLILTGQSGAIVGVFEQERTAILGYLIDPDHSQTLYEEYADKLVFSLVDISMLPKDCQPAQFWQRALKPLEDKCNQSQTLLESYQTCQQNQFDEYSLDKLMVQVKQEEWRLVLMLHRFDELLNNSNLKQPEFFALLRRLAASRTPSPLSLIISGNLSLKQFHDQTKHLNPKGSPYFNFMDSYEIVLGLLLDAKIDELLQKNGFSQVECQFIRETAGQHPHFIRLVAEALQKAKEHQEVQPWETIKKAVEQELPAIVANTLVNLNTKVYQTLVALKRGEQPATPTWIELLEKQGLLKKDANDKWQVSPPMSVDFIDEKEPELCNQ